MARLVHGKRALLNLPGHHGVAAIVAEIENTADWEEGKGRDGDEPTRYNTTPNIMCKITDCSSEVNIEFDIDTENSLENSLHKADTMIAALKALKRAMPVEHRRYVRRSGYIPPRDRHGI